MAIYLPEMTADVCLILEIGCGTQIVRTEKYQRNAPYYRVIQNQVMVVIQNLPSCQLLTMPLTTK